MQIASFDSSIPLLIFGYILSWISSSLVTPKKLIQILDQIFAKMWILPIQNSSKWTSTSNAQSNDDITSHKLMPILFSKKVLLK